MATVKKETEVTRKEISSNSNLFTKDNYMWMLVGGAVIALGFFLMAGGKSDDPKIFDPKEVYSFTRITIAPILIIAGLVIEIYAIMKKSKES